MKIKPVRGVGKFFTLQGMKLRSFFHYFGEWITGKISFSVLLHLLRRLLLFLGKIKKNKFFLYGKDLRVDLYIPYFGTKAFWQAADKFKAIDRKLPCTTVLLSITKACRFHCEHCYQRFDKGADSPIEKLAATAKLLQDQGIAFVNIEGGEPFLKYSALHKLCSSIDSRSEIWINSTGDGINSERLQELLRVSPLSGIMFSMHNAHRERMNLFMQSDQAWDIMEEGIRLCHKNGVPAAVNACLPKSAFYDGNFEALMEKAKSLGIMMIQIIHPKPAGEWLNNEFTKFTAKDLEQARYKVRLYNRGAHYKDYPAIYAQIDEEHPDMFGCTAGGTDRFYINAKGDVQPCEFLQLSYGNINKEDFSVIYQRMRADYPTENQSWLCEQIAPKINEIMSGEEELILPLDPEKTREIMKDADRGLRTKLYSDLKKR